MMMNSNMLRLLAIATCCLRAYAVREGDIIVFDEEELKEKPGLKVLYEVCKGYKQIGSEMCHDLKPLDKYMERFSQRRKKLGLEVPRRFWCNLDTRNYAGIINVEEALETCEESFQDLEKNIGTCTGNEAELQKLEEQKQAEKMRQDQARQKRAREVARKLREEQEQQSARRDRAKELARKLREEQEQESARRDRAKAIARKLRQEQEQEEKDRQAREEFKIRQAELREQAKKAEAKREAAKRKKRQTEDARLAMEEAAYRKAAREKKKQADAVSNLLSLKLLKKYGFDDSTRITRFNRDLKTLVTNTDNGLAEKISDFIEKTKEDGEDPMPCDQRIIIIKAMADPARGKFVSTIDRDLFTKKNLQQIFLKAGAIVNNMNKLPIRIALQDRLKNMKNLDKFRKWLDVKYPLEYPEWEEITTEMRRYVNTGLPQDRKLALCSCVKPLRCKC